MFDAIGRGFSYAVRFGILWLADAVSLLLTQWIVPGVTIAAGGAASRLALAVTAAFLLTIVNLLIRPFVLLIARPLGWAALFAVGFLVNAAALWITAWLMPGFTVTPAASLLGGLVFALFNAVFTGILDVDEEGSWYQNRIERRAKEQPSAPSATDERGLLMLEIDGLSYWHVQQAIARGLLPTLRRMIEEDGYVLSRVDCGLPSMTSSCQAGIMFGENDDIPAYRWYDKGRQKLYVSAADATELNARYAHGQGLMRQGSSIMNMMAGDAEKSLFTMANLWSGSEADRRRRAEDVALLMLNPYFLARNLALFVRETGRELWEAFLQRARNVQPRLNRLEHGYPFVRAAMCGLMRDLTANVAVLDLLRGVPSIYMLYLGYDEVAHHSGPWTSDAFGDLRRLDRTIARLREVSRYKAPRAYSFVILSDHGQSFGATFEQRYGVSLRQLIEQQLPQGVSVAQAIGGDRGAFGLQGAAGEFANVQQMGAANAVGARLIRQGEKLAQRGAAAVPAQAAAAQAAAAQAPASVTAYGSGNAAQVYFDLAPRKLTLSELEAAYPGMVHALVQHPGLGLVIGYADDMTAVALGKGGRRNLHTGAVEGADPVAPYAPAAGPGAAALDTRVWQLRRVMDFPSAGDLWVISTLYPDGTVAALEELVGSHGGVGGEQTDAFLFHPPDLHVPETRCSTDVFHILNGYRSAGPGPAPAAPASGEGRDWSPAVLLRGLRRPRLWLGLALRCLLLDRDAYRRVARDRTLTGPALLIALVSLIGAGAIRAGGLYPLPILLSMGLWFLAALVIDAAGRLPGRGGSFTRTLRALGFARVTVVIELLALYPPLASAAHAVALLAGLLAMWLAAATAHNLKGWRAALLPLLVIAVYLLGGVLLYSLVWGAGFTWQTLLEAARLTPQ